MSEVWQPITNILHVFIRKYIFINSPTVGAVRIMKMNALNRMASYRSTFETQILFTNVYNYIYGYNCCIQRIQSKCVT